MVKHIVIWKLKHENCEENKQTFKKMLVGLDGRVPSLVDIEVGLKGDSSPENNHDVVLVTSFKSWDDLDAYQVHPEHLEVVEFAKMVVDSRSAVDYEY